MSWDDWRGRFLHLDSCRAQSSTYSGKADAARSFSQNVVQSLNLATDKYRAAGSNMWMVRPSLMSERCLAIFSSQEALSQCTSASA